MADSEHNNQDPENITATEDVKLGKSSHSSNAENRYLATAISAFKDDNSADESFQLQQEGTNICPLHNVPLNFWDNKK